MGAPGVYNWVGTMIKTIDKTVVDPVASRLRTRRSYVVPETTVAAASEYTTSSVFQLFGMFVIGLKLFIYWFMPPVPFLSSKQILASLT